MVQAGGSALSERPEREMVGCCRSKANVKPVCGTTFPTVNHGLVGSFLFFYLLYGHVSLF